MSVPTHCILVEIFDDADTSSPNVDELKRHMSCKSQMKIDQSRRNIGVLSSFAIGRKVFVTCAVIACSGIQQVIPPVHVQAPVAAECRPRSDNGP